jgi:hypothetical protein
MANTVVWSAANTVGTTAHGKSIGQTTVDFTNEPLRDCTKITKPRCTRLYVRFTDPANSGAQNLLEVDVSAVTLNSLTNTERGSSSDIQATVSKDKLITVSDVAGAVEYVTAASVGTTGTFAAGSLDTLTSITLAGTSGSDILPINSVINIACASHDMGDYTVAATFTISNAALTITQAFNDPHDYCNGATFTIQGKTNYIIVTGADLTYVPLSTLATAVKISTTTITSTISSISFDSTTTSSYLLLSETPQGVSAIASAAANSNELKFSGAGTKEGRTCSDRGNCDFETGECNCFKGYSGEACQNQNALWLGA